MLGSLPNKLANPIKPSRIIATIALFAGAFAHGQAVKLENMPLRFITGQTDKLIAEGKFAEVAPYLDELELRFEDNKDPKIKDALQKFGFIRGVAFLQTFAKSNDKQDLRKAAKAFGFFAEKFPDDAKALEALEKRTVCLRALNDFRAAAIDIEKLLDPKGKFLSKIKKASRILDLRFGLAQCYHIEQDWANGETAFITLREEADKANHEDYLAYGVSCLTEMYITLAEKDRSKLQKVDGLLPYLAGDTPARYDLRLNVNLYKGAMYHKEDGVSARQRGDSAGATKAFVKASLLLALTMTTEEIEGYYAERLARLKTQQREMEAYLKANDRILTPRRKETYQDALNQIAVKLNVAQGHIDSVKSMDSYTTTLRWRKAENFKDVDRNWEAFWAFYWLYKDAPNHEMVENFIFAAFTSANKVKASTRVIELGTDYISNKKWTKYRSDITSILAKSYLDEARRLEKESTSDASMSTADKQALKKESEGFYSKFFSLCDNFMKITPDHVYTKNIINMMGSTYLAREQYDDLFLKFAGIKDGKVNPSLGYLNDKNCLKVCPALGACSYYVGFAFISDDRVENGFAMAKPYFEAVVGVSVRNMTVQEEESAEEGEPETQPTNPPEPEPAEPPEEENE